MDDRKVVDYFVVAGFDERDAHSPEGVDEKSSMKAFEEPQTKDKAPITDITVIFVDLGETVPEGYEIISKTPSGLTADLNHGSYRAHEAYLCFRRGRDKPPLVDVGAMYEGKEQLLGDSEIVQKTPKGNVANVNNSSTPKTFFTFRRAQPTMSCNSLVVTDVAIIIKGESPPHAFCVVRKNLNRALVGSDVFLCYKKSVNRARLINYSPRILMRYPFDDRPNLPLPETVPMFCMPMGCSLEKWPSCAQQAQPIFSTFVLTVSDAAEKLYGSAVTFYEPYPSEKLTDDQKSQLGVTEDDIESFTYKINKCICLLSRWPFFETYDKYLMFLFEMSQGKGPHQVSIERIITYFLEDVPFPSPQRPRILVQLSLNDRLILTQPEDVPLPRSGAGFRSMLLHLGPDNCLLVLLCALTEQKILVHSLRPDLLTSLAEAISMIVFPFKWQCPYIPRCPLGLAEVLHAPLPFLIGVDSRFFDLYDPPPDVNCIDLDTNNITICEEKKSLTIKLLPKKPGRILRYTLEKIRNKLHEESMNAVQQKSAENCIDKEFQLKKKEQALEFEIQEAFLKFMANILKGYRNFLLPITKAPTIGTTDTNSLFDLQGFIRSRDKTYLKFYSYIVRTQMFIRFIEERSFVSDMDAGLAFFDECAEKVNESGDDSNVRLLEVDDSHHSERTVFIMPPEPIGPPGHVYHYDGFNVDPEELRKSCRLANDGNVGGGGAGGGGVGGEDRGDSLGRRFRGGQGSNRFSSTFDDSSVDGGETNVSTSLAAPPPGSPMARRTKQEIKVAQKLARRLASSPQHWARCLLATCYSIWYIHLPSYAMISQNPPGVLVYAYDRLLKAKSLRLDEICYRVMMQLCGLYSQPILAVKLLNHMRKYGFQPNAITYGFYNRAVLEATWPSDMSHSSQILWNKLRNAVRGVALFRRAGVAAGRRRMSSDDLSAAVGSGNGGLAIASQVALGGSRTSIDSADSSAHGKLQSNENQVNSNFEQFAAFDKFRSKYGTVVRPSGYQLITPTSSFNRQPFESSAGLLITGALGSTFKEESPLDLEQIDAVATPLALSTPIASSSTQVPIPGSHQNHHHHHPSTAKRYYRSGSCSEFNPPPTSPPKPPSTLKILTRSESFAHDAGILAKLHMLKMESSSFQASQGASQNSIASDASPSKQLLVNQLHKPWQPKAVFKRRNSLTLKKFMDPTASDSYESSTENLGSIGSGAGGSIEDIYGDRSATLDTPKRNKLLNALGAKLHRLAPAEDEGYGEEESSDAAPDTTGSPPPASSATLTTPGGLVKSPSRTPVTENDPLGALDLDVSPIRGGDDDSNKKSSPVTVSRAASEIELDVSGTPVLFDRRTAGRRWNSVVTRSATFVDDEATTTVALKSGSTGVKDGGGQDAGGGSTLHRSSTVPSNVGDVTDVGGGGEAGNSSFGSFKLPFSRYSPSRFSLRKTADRLNAQLIENAINSFSSSSLTSKKSNELIMGGLSSLKSAATSVAKKIDEIKGAISANSTPHKSGGSLRSTLERDACLYEDDSEYGDDSYISGSVGGGVGGQSRRKISSEFSPLNRSSGLSGGSLAATGIGSVNVPYGTAEAWGANLFDWFAGGGGELSASSRKGSTAELAGAGGGGAGNGFATESLLNLVLTARPPRDPSIPVALEVIMTTCSKCHNCSSLLYDEEIMCGWIPEDSNLNTKCQFCDKATVPLLSVSVIDFRGSPMPSSSNKERKISSVSLTTSRTSLLSESVSATNSNEGKSCEPITVPYLNPLVLRKEFESILAAEGDVSLTRSTFVDEHPIIYWNIVWTFTRIGMESHLPGLALASRTAAMAEPHPSWQNVDSSHVQVTTMWHNTRLHDEVGQPMYSSWNTSNQPSSLVSALVTDHTPIQNSTMQKVISCLQCNDLQEPLKCLALERQKCKGRGHSLYREILFLGILAIGRDNIDQVVFDKEYRAAYERATERNDPKLFLKIDQPPSSGAIHCRRYFTPLDL